MSPARPPTASPAAEVVPSEPQVTPPDWTQERDAGHLWSAISTLGNKTGELSSAIAGCDKHIADLRGDFKDLDKGIHELKSEQIAVARSVKVFGWIATPVLAIAAVGAPYFWSKAMRPDLEKTIADSVKADIEREAAAKERTRTLEQKVSDLEAELRKRPAK